MKNWNIYEVTAEKSPIKGVMFRGRVRKFALQNKIELLIENATDKENCVRFAVTEDQSLDQVTKFIQQIIPNSQVKLTLDNVQNPVLSKLKVNKEERYSI